MTKEAQSFVPAWQRILSDGHAWVERLNLARSRQSFCPRTSYVLMGCAIFGLIIGKVYFSTASDWIVSKVTSGVNTISAPEKSGEVVLRSQVREMLRGAISDGNKATLDANALLYGIVVQGTSEKQTIFTAVEEIASGKGQPSDYVPFPEIGKPWPSEGELCVKKVGDLIWIGIRVKANRGDAAWLGVIRKEGEKNVLYGINNQYGNIPVIDERNIPRALIAAGFAENGATKESDK